MNNISSKEQRKKSFMEIYGVATFGEILNFFEKDYNRYKNTNMEKGKELFRDYSYAIFFLYSPSSIRNNLVKFKNIIKKNGGKYEKNILSMFEVDAVYSTIKSKDKERKEEKKEKILRGENEKINPDLSRQKIRELERRLLEKDYTIGKSQKEDQVRSYLLFMVIALATGRRFAEILKTLKLSKRKDIYYFSGLTKGNNEQIIGHIIELSYQELSKYLRELRKIVKTENMKIEEINPKFARVFNNSIKKTLNVSAKELRREYAIVGSEIFKEAGETEEQTITRILGHKEVLSSALNYT